MSQAVAISCKGVSKRFTLIDGGNAWRLAFGMGKDMPFFQALDGVTFDVPKGQFVGVLGRNGAGKSTLLRVLGGVYSPDKGSVSVSGAMSAIYELGLVGNPQLTGRAYAERLLTVHGFERRERAVMIEDIHEFSELGDRFDDPVLTYSAGMGARLFFSAATAGSYEVYLLDEVLSVGDQHFRAKCWRRLRDRISRGASGVLVTHDWAAIVRMCETAHVLQRGRVLYSGAAEKAARMYLYGEEARATYVADNCRFTQRPETIITAVPGEDVVLEFGVRLNAALPIGCTCAVERLQPGYGWETALMTRAAMPVTDRPGDYILSVTIPRLPLEPGSYQISLHLTTPDLEIPGRLKLLDGLSWLDGNGLALEVVGAPGSGLTLPLRWQVDPSRGEGA
ncbi:MAG: ATP-binding cassette domain-containing protein [Opitutales bacterium]|nr:ATP-binding cassette domain-containing protein [Opitutales bacterium]